MENDLIENGLSEIDLKETELSSKCYDIFQFCLENDLTYPYLTYSNLN